MSLVNEFTVEIFFSTCTIHVLCPSFSLNQTKSSCREYFRKGMSEEYQNVSELGLENFLGLYTRAEFSSKRCLTSALSGLRKSCVYLVKTTCFRSQSSAFLKQHSCKSHSRSGRYTRLSCMSGVRICSPHGFTSLTTAQTQDTELILWRNMPLSVT